MKATEMDGCQEIALHSMTRPCGMCSAIDHIYWQYTAEMASEDKIELMIISCVCNYPLFYGMPMIRAIMIFPLLLLLFYGDWPSKFSSIGVV